MERPKLPIYMKFKPRLSESMVGEAKAVVAPRRLVGDLCMHLNVVDFILVDAYTGANTCEKSSSCTLKTILLYCMCVKPLKTLAKK